MFAIPQRSNVGSGSKAGISNTLPLLAAAAGVPQRADPRLLPAATVVTGQVRTSWPLFDQPETGVTLVPSCQRDVPKALRILTAALGAFGGRPFG